MYGEEYSQVEMSETRSIAGFLFEYGCGVFHGSHDSALLDALCLFGRGGLYERVHYDDVLVQSRVGGKYEAVIGGGREDTGWVEGQGRGDNARVAHTLGRLASRRFEYEHA